MRLCAHQVHPSAPSSSSSRFRHLRPRTTRPSAWGQSRGPAAGPEAQDALVPSLGPGLTRFRAQRLMFHKISKEKLPPYLPTLSVTNLLHTFPLIMVLSFQHTPQVAIQLLHPGLQLVWQRPGGGKVLCGTWYHCEKNQPPPLPSIRHGGHLSDEGLSSATPRRGSQRQFGGVLNFG